MVSAVPPQDVPEQSRELGTPVRIMPDGEKHKKKFEQHRTKVSRLKLSILGRGYNYELKSSYVQRIG